MREVLTFLLAGGRGERLDPLTRDRTKPAVPFGGIYRIIDFTLSNCINSGLRRVYILTQYKSFSLQKHILEGWDIVSTQLGEFIDIIPAQQRIGSDWYKGTADAIYQNLYSVEDWDPELILVLSGDHVYKMDYRQLIAYHRDKEADMTVACVPMPKEDSQHFGVIEVDKKNHVLGFQEKPQDPKTIPGSPSQISASMGIYLFKRSVLVDELSKDSQAVSEHDFGKNIIPQMIQSRKKVFAYNFEDEQGRPRYWRDIGTRDAYYQSNLDLLGRNAKFDLFDKSWPVRTYHEQYPPIKVVSTQSGTGRVLDSLISPGCAIEGGFIERSILSPNVKIYDGAEIRNSIIMEGVVVGAGTKIQNAIIDKEVFIPPLSKIGYDLDMDRKRSVLTTSGIVIVAKKTHVPPE